MASLTYDEWCYVLFERETTSGIRFAKGQVNEIFGLFILPDEWNSAIFELNDPNQNEADFYSNIVSNEVLVDVLQKNGAVFLPAAGNRMGTTVLGIGTGDYWSSKRKLDHDFVYDICIQSFSLGHSTFNAERAQSVRLVRDI